MKLVILIATVPAYLMLASCASPNNSPIQQAMADTARANAQMGLTPAGAPLANGFKRQPTGGEKFFDAR